MDNEEEFEEIEELSDESDFDSVDSNNNEYSNDVSYENISDNVTDMNINHSSNETPQTDDSNLKEKLNENKGYNKADSKRQAYEKKLDNKNYYNDKKKELEGNKNKLNSDKKENKNRRDTAEKRLEQAKQNKLNNNNKSNRKELKEAKKEDKESKKENKEQEKKEKQLKKDEKNIKKDSKKAKRFAATHPVEAAKMKLNKLKKAIIKKIIAFCAPVILGILLAIFVIYLILSPLMEAWGHIDEGITKVANFSEKVTNFYNGHGFQDTKQAFYDELEYWYEEYDKQLDIALLLSTIFYTETMGYDTEYGDKDMLKSDTGDIAGLNSTGLWGTVKSYLKDKYMDSFETTGEDGLNYTSGKIVRLRKLSRHQFETGMFGLEAIPKGKTAYSLGDYIDRVEHRLGNDIIKLLKEIPSVFNVFNIRNTIYNLIKIVEGEENAASLADSEDGLLAALKRVLKEIFYTMNDITDIDIGAKDKDGNYSAIVVNVSTYEYNEEEYDQYLKEYYIPNMPEFKNLLASSGSARTEKIDQIIREIKENKETFKDIFLQYVETESEVYTESCVGAIDPVLVKELELPVKVPDGTTISFTDGDTAYGIRDAVNHNGVDLNNSTAGVNEGDDVFAIASGKVIESDSSCDIENDDECEKPDLWVKIEHNIVVENKEYKFYSVYRHLQANSGQPVVGANVAKGDVIGKVGNAGDSPTAHLHFEFIENDGTTDGNAIDPTNLFIPCNIGTSATLTGNSNEEKIWNWLMSEGYTKIAAAGIMGNWQHESGFLANNLENGANSKSGMSDAEYTAAVDDGSISRADFIQSYRFGIPPQPGTTYNNLIYGYGLAQWTQPGRKTIFYDYWATAQSGISIGDLGLQLNFYKQETIDTFTSLPGSLNSASTPEEAASIFVRIYEQGTCPNTRKQYARQIYNKYSTQ